MAGRSAAGAAGVCSTGLGCTRIADPWGLVVSPAQPVQPVQLVSAGLLVVSPAQLVQLVGW